MEENIKILSYLAQIDHLEERIKGLPYGTIEIREKGGKKYIYTHRREDGIAKSTYVGEFSETLYNTILKNTAEVKSAKKEIKKVRQELEKIGYKKYDLPEEVEKNIDFAKKHLVFEIYNQAVLEGIATTYPDTETVVEGGKVNNMTADDVLKVINLKHAWEFILNKDVLMSPTNFSILCEINKFVEEGFYYNAGKVRSTPVLVGGTKWKPEIPTENVTVEEMREILQSQQNDLDKAIDLLLFVMKKQIFLDGNKRTAVIFANHLVIQKGLGLIAITNDNVEDFKRFLIDFYEGKDEQNIRNFLREKCYIKI